ncbi:hypothetical protein SK875_p00132 (plasmid) [Burkholderia contaminans]|nr:hypothetical protein SK875_p00132 [Burkholderia contaminans]
MTGEKLPLTSILMACRSHGVARKIRESFRFGVQYRGEACAKLGGALTIWHSAYKTPL